jgi:hypothetical protein
MKKMGQRDAKIIFQTGKNKIWFTEEMKTIL